jgi:molybdenum cofactor guanylyltransferase
MSLIQSDNSGNRLAARLLGLVLTGGQSTRMGKDKAALVLHGETQSVVCFNLLQTLCEAVYLSNRQEQSELPGHADLPQIHDQYTNIGPLAGLLSAMATYPDAAWLVVACDMPYLTNAGLQRLINNRNPLNVATAFINPQGDFPEPLCAIYEPLCREVLLSAHARGEYSLQAVLSQVDIERIMLTEASLLQSINTPDAYDAACQT